MTATAESTARRYEQHERRVESGHRADVAPDCPRPTRSMFAGRSTWSADCDCPSCTERRAASRAASAAASAAAARTRAERAKTATAEVNAGAWTAKDAHEGSSRLGVPASAPDAPALDGGGAGWRDLALCARLDVDPDAWFPGTGRYGEDLREIREACMSCPVRETCLATALEYEAGLPRELRYGIWGGLNPRERAALDPGRRPPGGQVKPDCFHATYGNPGRGVARHQALGEELCGPCQQYDTRSRARVERDDRVAQLAAEGNTAWQIALATGEPYSTVRRVLARSGVGNSEAPGSTAVSIARSPY